MVGTSFGRVFFGKVSAEMGKASPKVYLALVHGLIKTHDVAVTSLALSTFNPDGNLLVGFDDGEVRVWQSATIKKEQ